MASFDNEKKKSILPACTLQDDEEAASIENDWKFAAMVLDRSAHTVH